MSEAILALGTMPAARGHCLFIPTIDIPLKLTIRQEKSTLCAEGSPTLFAFVR